MGARDTIVGAVLGAVVAAVHVLGAGMLHIQSSGARDGAVYTLTNELVSIEPPTLPLGAMLAQVLIAALVLAIVLSGRIMPSTWGLWLGYLVTALVLVVLGLALTDLPLQEGFPRGATGWITAGASVSAVHLCLVLVAARVATALARRRAAEGAETSAGV